MVKLGILNQRVGIKILKQGAKANPGGEGQRYLHYLTASLNLFLGRVNLFYHMYRTYYRVYI